MKINRQGKSRTLSTEELDLVNNYLPTEKHKLISLVLRKTAGRISEVVALRYENLEKFQFRKIYSLSYKNGRLIV